MSAGDRSSPEGPPPTDRSVGEVVERTREVIRRTRRLLDSSRELLERVRRGGGRGPEAAGEDEVGERRKADQG